MLTNPLRRGAFKIPIGCSDAYSVHCDPIRLPARTPLSNSQDALCFVDDALESNPGIIYQAEWPFSWVTPIIAL